MKQLKPAVIHSVFLPSLKGKETKMSASQPDTSIWLSDTPKQIQKKINNSFSGGQDTKELQQQLGGRTEVDIPYQYLTFFLEDDEELEKIRQAYEKGEMLTGEIKKRCMEEVQSYVKQFQERRAKVTDEMLDEFLRPRVLEFKGFSQESMKPADNAREVAALKARQAELKKTAREVQKLTKEMEQKLASLDAAQ
jgi:tryptophanyl-tRNA synthetase